ncbi:MAG: CidA/LrgA family protein [Lachnospiraceae bacterium]|uniref:CidA/LrgA family protein n=1 Tax=Candidatus Enterocloster excrementigallinarum TaxID=2838558 RepID=A0A9D2PTV7_9FIRM|nr:CidA/LrgA family protein [Lachnospiraceae bacterium]HJC67147.1 CidA/LrgA family protein [Candidatus Enterocloster excrementigallinarum]
MKYVRQIGIIWGMTMAGEFLNFLLPFPVPAGVYGLFLLLGALLTGVVKIESVEATGNFLMDIMSMMFIPATVGLVEYAQQIGEILVPYTVIIACSTVAVMAATGRLAQVMIERQERKMAERKKKRK